MTQKIAFFIPIPIEPECTEMDTCEKKSFAVIDLPDTCIQNNIKYDLYTLYLYGSLDYKNRVTRKFTLQKMVLTVLMGVPGL